MSAGAGITRAALLALAVAFAWPAPGEAQLIQVRTVPVAAGDQFLIFPSENLGMAGASIALDDTILDPFVHPAKGALVASSQLFGSPSFYSISGTDAGGRTLPVGGIFAGRDWFGAVAASLQQVDAAARFGGFTPFGLALTTGRPLRGRTGNNVYAHGALGRRLPGTELAIGGSVTLAGLNAVDGVDLLYATSQSIEQSGHMADVRVGLYGAGHNGGTFELLLLHNRFDMTHDVTYVDRVWDETAPATQTRIRLERNLDRTDTWGLHLGYVRPVAGSDWRVGGILTTNWKSHPKIPNYEIMNIPRDPGHSWAYDFGVGAARIEGPTTLAIDAIYEPIWSDTWAEADAPVQTRTGRTIPVGGRTVENDFRFSNALLRLGVGRQMGSGALQLGLQLRSIRYRLEQQDNVRETFRTQTEHWLEWTPTWGGAIDFSDLELRYLGRVTTGTGRPGVDMGWPNIAGNALEVAGTSFIVAPQGPLTLQDARVTTHQLSISVPLGR